MVTLNDLADNEGARKNGMRVGRGIGSGKGKTCGRGVKGQKARTGVAIKGFEGGQMPIFRRLPKRGFHNIHGQDYALVNLRDLQAAVDAKKLSKGAEVSAETLVELGIIRSTALPVKLLGTGELKTALTLTVSRASKTAAEAVAKAGGKLTILEAGAA
jgi:large subunit ribosomal protein L15